MYGEPTVVRDRARISLPPVRDDYNQHIALAEQAFRGMGREHEVNKLMRQDDLHEQRPPVHPDSSPFQSASSPTVAALQNRRTYISASQHSRDSSSLTASHNAHSASQYTAKALRRNTGQYEPLNNAALQTQSSRISLSHAPPTIRGVQLICTADLPDRVRTVFPYEVLNVVQSKCYHVAFESGDNLVVSAPTGSGKTAIMELAVCRLIAESNNTDFKVIYQAPTKSLCSERYRDWEIKFKVLGLDCAELTGDTDYDHLRKVQQANIIITTPEKWDSVTRKWRDNMKLVEMIKLFLVDEVHILKDQRGATLEAVVSRMKSIGTAVRFVALSATVPNSQDIAAWLGKDVATPDMPAAREVFDETYRPVKLEKHVYGFNFGSNDFGMDHMLRKQIPEMINKHGRRKPTMVFCMTRKSSMSTAADLASFWANSRRQQPWPAPKQTAAVGDPDLRKIISAGVAFHHGGLSADDRFAVEQEFLQGNISVICSTSTLALGVNLPCYLVILQGTVAWTGGGIRTYSDLEIMQMLGRAGRPQFETSACAVILTREQQVAKYQKMVSGQELLESTLHLNLIEHLNAEIGLGTIYDMPSAKRWLSSTFLRIRVAQNPAHYQLGEDQFDADVLMHRLCEKDVQALLNANMVEDRGRIKCTDLGDAMARYYVNFETMKTFASIPPRAKMSEILSILTQAAEFCDIRVRGGEKSYYKELNKKTEILSPINVDIALASHKVSIILQAELGGASLPDGDNFRKHHQQHSTDKVLIFGHANRLIRCIIDCQIHLKDAISVRSALELGRSIAARAWDGTPRQLKQLPDIGDVSCRKLASRGINSIEKLLSKEPHQIEMALGKGTPFGTRLLAKLESFPRLRVSVKEMGREVSNGRGALLKLKGEIGFLNASPPISFNKTQIYVCFLVEDSNGTLIDFRRFGACKIGCGEEIFLSARLETPTNYIRCYVMCDEVVGTCTYAELKVDGLPRSTFPAGLGLSTKMPVIARNERGAFDDDGIADDDFAAVPGHDTVEIVEDIDQLLLAAEDNSRSANISTKRKQSVNNNDIETVPPTEPEQLPNGRWTCNHLCKHKGIECKHKCCHEGVAKRRKRQRTKEPANDGKQQTITGMGTGITKVANSKQSSRATRAAPSNVVKEAHLPIRRPKNNDLDGVVSEQSREDRSPIDQSHQQPDLTGDSVFDVEEDMYDPMECDWPTCKLYETEPDVARESPRVDFSEVFTLDEHGFDSEREEAPQAIVSMQDVQLDVEDPFHPTEQSSSPVKKLNIPASTSHKRHPMIHNEHSLATSPHREVEQNTSMGSMTDSSPDFDSVRPDKMKTSGLDLDSHHKDDQENSSLDISCRGLVENDTEAQKKQLSWEEDQKRKWAEFPAWMYEQFGAFTDIID